MNVPESYKTKSGLEVNIKKTLAICDLDLYLRARLLSLLESVPHPYDDDNYGDFEKKELVVYGSLNNASESSGYWYTETGQCLGCNADNRSYKKEIDFLSGFDLDL